MAITIRVQGPKGAGKTHLLQEVVAFLQSRGYGGQVQYPHETRVIYWDGTQPQRVAILEVDAEPDPEAMAAYHASRPHTSPWPDDA